MKPLNADLSPPLGWPGGPCQVVDRIDQKIRSPRVRDDLSEKVEHGQKLTNPEAAKVYTLEKDRGGGIFRSLKITPHAQYRMDQRSITVGDIRTALEHFSRQLSDWKSRRDWQWAEFERKSQQAEPIEYIDKRLGDLQIVFRNERGMAVLITTYWVGMSDPRPESCSLPTRQAALTVEEESGYRTFVKDPSPQESDTGKPEKSDGKYPDRGLPYPKWRNNTHPIGPERYNVPGESGSNSDGNIHKDKVRTKGTPGGQYDNGKTHPTPDDTDSLITPHQHPGHAAGYQPQYPSPHPPVHQKVERGQAYRYFAKRYHRNRGKVKKMVKRRYNRLKNNHRFTVRRQWARDNPKRHERRPGGPTSIKDRSQREREKSKNKTSFERIPFYHLPSETWGMIHEASPLGNIRFELEGEYRAADFDAFFRTAVIEDQHLDPLFSYFDQVFVESPDRLARRVLATFFREQRPPDMDPDSESNRGTPPEKLREDRKKQRREKPGDPDWGTYDNEVHDSNPGSRVLPTGKGHIEKEGDFNLQSLPPAQRDGLIQLIRSPVWRHQNSSPFSNKKVLDFLQQHGWESLTERGMNDLIYQIAHHGVVKKAALIRDIQAGNAPDLVARSQNIPVKLARVDRKNGVWLYNVQGSTGPYRVRLKAIRKGNTRDIQKLHVKVSCSCPFWRWQGPEHWAKQGGYLFGRPQGSASKPSIKDPDGSHRACKHVLAVLGFVSDRPWSQLRPWTKKARYLFDTLRIGEMMAQNPRFNHHVDKVAHRYIVSREVTHA